MSDTFTRDSDGEKFTGSDLVMPSDLYHYLDINGLQVIKPVQPKRWRADGLGDYWFVDSMGDVSDNYDGGYSVDNLRYELGNYFKTREQAEAAAEAVKALFEYIHDSSSIPRLDDVVTNTCAARMAVQGDK